MSDGKYAKFFLGTMIKLSLFLVLCAAGNYIFMRFLPAPLNRLAPSLAAALITFIFLTAVERNTRSFFAKGYMLQNVMVGGIWGLGAAAAGPLIGLAFKVRIFDLYADFDITEIFLNAVSTALFLAIVIFGYFFHILQNDFGAIPAIIVSSLVYGIFSAIQGMTGIADFEALVPAVAYYAVIGIAAGMLIIGLGDMRSAAAFLFFYSVISQICGAFTTGGRSFWTDLAAPIMAVFCAVSMLIDIRRDKR